MKIKVYKSIGEMSAKELQEAYIRANKRILHAKKRIEHEEGKEFTNVAIKVQSSKKDFPYTQYGAVTLGPDPQELQQSKIVIDKWRNEIKQQEKRKDEIEKRLDKIEDVELAEIAWKYVVEGKTQQEIAREIYKTQKHISIFLKQV